MRNYVYSRSKMDGFIEGFLARHIYMVDLTWMMRLVGVLTELVKTRSSHLPLLMHGNSNFSHP